MHLLRNPVISWLITAIICWIITIIPGSDGSFDITSADTYFVIAYDHVLYLITILLIIGWAWLQFVPCFRSIRVIYLLHVIGTIIGVWILIGCALFEMYGTSSEPVYKDYDVYDDSFLPVHDAVNYWIAVALMLPIFLQVCWIIQPLVWIFRRF
jgi:hypothetical protein